VIADVEVTELALGSGVVVHVILVFFFVTAAFEFVDELLLLFVLGVSSRLSSYRRGVES
jgi:hypothetical protein